MKKRIFYSFVASLVALTLLISGCAGLQSSGSTGASAASAGSSSTGSSSGSSNTYPAPGGPGAGPNGQFTLPLSAQLALGMLSLEDTDSAVTAEQAAKLLPLWQTVLSLSSDPNGNSEQLDAAVKQIQAAMTAAQLDAIQKMDLTGQNLMDLAQTLGINLPSGPGIQGTLTPDQRATMDANRANGQPPQAPLAGVQGTPPAPGAQGAPDSSGQAAPPAGRGGGFESAFYQAVIDLLQQKTSSEQYL